jgi:hypothetical protein
MYFMGPLFLLRSFSLLSRESLGEASQRFQNLAFNSCQLPLPSGPAIPILWITKEIMSQGPQVVGMECRETT